MATPNVTRLEPRGPQPMTPPHNIEAEESVLGSILLVADRTMHALVLEESLKPGDFYRERNGVIYTAMLDLYGAAEPIDKLTVTEQLRKTGNLDQAGGAEAIDLLAASPPNAGHLREYAKIVRETSLLRRLLASAQEIQASVLDQRDDARDVIEQAERAILEVAHGDRTRDFRRIDEILEEELEKLEQLSRAKTNLTGTPSGFRDLDEITGGFQKGNLIVVAARPSMGKSALVANIAENASIENNAAVALFSLEMSETELAQRFVASQGRIRGEQLRKGRVPAEQWQKIVKASQRLASAPLWVDDSSDLGLLELRAKARRLHAERNLDLVIVDYLQLMRTEGRSENRAEQIGQISRGLKLLARELKVPVIALSQLNRGVESRTDKRPLLSDLRESGAIEQDADVVIFIYRDEYYNPHDTERPGEADLIISKHRNGALGDVRLTFQSEYPRFMNYANADRFAE